MIILTAEDADKVAGLSPTNSHASIEPVPLKNGTFMLNEDVLDDPAHADVREFLQSLPKRPVPQSERFAVNDDVPGIQRPLVQRKPTPARNR
jgi:hypothetical protein